MRTILALAALASVALAHGGLFRPPPRSGPRDPARTPPGRSPTTRRGTGAGTLPEWEYWWRFNRDRYLRVRERMIHREVITGPGRREDLFDRKGVREEVLVPVVIEALSDPDQEVRTSAAVAAGKFRARAAVPMLLKIFRQDKVKQVREAALLGLLLLREASLRDVFRKIALDGREERRLRGFAVLALGFLRDSGFLQELLAGRSLHLIGSGTAVDEVRACAALALGYAGDPSAARTLVRAATSRTAPRQVVGYASAALGKLGNPIALPEVLALLRNKDARKEARYGAAIAVGGMVSSEEERIIDSLGRMALRDDDGGVRALVIMSLGRIGGSRAVGHIVSGMSRCEQRLRGFHYLAIGISGSKEAAPLLLEEFKKLSNNSDRAACALGLGLCGFKLAAPVLRAQVSRGNLAFAPHGMVALGLLDDREAIPLVQAALRKSRDPVMRQEGAIALALLRRSAATPELLELLEKSRALYTRGAVAAALGLVGTAKAVEPLLAIFRDRKRQGEERAIALAALGRIGDPEPIPLLTRIAFDLNPYVVVEAVGEALTIL